jgi:hypothetical protein
MDVPFVPEAEANQRILDVCYGKADLQISSKQMGAGDN